MYSVEVWIGILNGYEREDLDNLIIKKVRDKGNKLYNVEKVGIEYQETEYNERNIKNTRNASVNFVKISLTLQGDIYNLEDKRKEEYIEYVKELLTSNKKTGLVTLFIKKEDVIVDVINCSYKP